MKIFAFAVALCFSVMNCFAAETWWPQFRGPNGSGVSENARPPARFGPGTNQLWKVALPEGVSSPVIWGDRIFVTAFDAGKLEVRCHARRDGRQHWKQVVPTLKLEDYHATEGSPAASSCATDGRRVVSYFGSFGLICHNFEGKELWRHPLPVAETAGGFGTGASPTLAGGLVILNRDMVRNCSLLAVDLKTGRRVWEAARPDAVQSYSSTMVWKHKGVDGMRSMMARGENVLVAVRPGGRGELGTNEIAWKQTRGLPYVPSPLYYKGHVYLVKDGGMVSCYDAKTGRPLYQQERLNALGNYYASPVAADGRVMVASLDGKVTVFAAGGDAPKILSQSDFKERIAATPALVRNQVYVRTPTALYAFGE